MVNFRMQEPRKGRVSCILFFLKIQNLKTQNVAVDHVRIKASSRIYVVFCEAPRTLINVGIDAGQRFTYCKPCVPICG